MQDNNEKSIEELRIEAERAELQARIRNANNSLNSNNSDKDEERIKRASTLKGLSIANLCIIPAALTLWILPLIQTILVSIHRGNPKNNGLKIAAALLTFVTVFIGSILTLVYASRETCE